MQQLPPALAALGAYRQFLCYSLTPHPTKPGKMIKKPVSPITGEVVSAHDPAHWVDATTACTVATAWGSSYGVAFSFQSSDPFFFVDLDNHYDGAWSEFAQQVVSMFPGAALEVSQSGRGLHIFGKGAAPAHGCRDDARGIELYTEGRFVALTGLHTSGDAGTDHTAALARLVASVPGLAPGNGSSGGAWALGLSAAPEAEWVGPMDDADLIRRALASRSVASIFGAAKASFADLWECNTEVLRLAYPDPDRLYDASAADAALVSHLAFWTGKHGERIERLMRQSKLVRDKWERDDYLPRTIGEVLARGGDVLRDKPVEPPRTPIAETGAPMQANVEGETYLNLEAQRRLFAGCVYIQDRHKALVPGGHMLKPEQFKVAYGGYSFVMDMAGTRTVRNAWEAFTESQILRAPLAESTCFKPDQPPASIISIAGRTYVNTWAPALVKRNVGDVSRFMNHLRRVLPDERDQTIFLSYMAACVQYKGVKFNWCPVLQGAEGNGKTLFSWCVAEAIGIHYCHWPHATDLASDFNGWLSNKVFIGVEELYSQEHQTEIVEKLKTIIAGGQAVQIQFKGVDQVSMEICCNLMVTTNYRTAIKKTPDNARRFCTLFSAQQTKADIERDGMGGDYFPDLYGWLKNDGGFAVVSELLHTFPIPDEFNPATRMHRAPNTSTSDAAIAESRGGVEQTIQEAIDQGLPGFLGGWVSSVQLDKLLESIHMGSKITHLKRREMMASMGYMLHPGLIDGRTNNPVQPDGRKPQLWVRTGGGLESMTGAAEIARAYSAAQLTAMSPVAQGR